MPLNVFSIKALSLLAVILAMCGSNLAFAQSTMSSPSEISSVFACRDIADSDLRLSCYDKAVGRLETAQKSGRIVAIDKTELEKIERETFGFNIPSLSSISKVFGGLTDNTPSIKKKADKEKDIKNNASNIILEIGRTKEFGYKKIRFYFKNGQVWEQTDTKRLRISKNNPGNAHIRKASLGSFFLQMNGSGPAIVVRRIR